MTAPLTPDPAPVSAPAAAVAPPLRGAVISGVIGGAIGAVMSAGVNYAIFGMPDSEAVNAVNHAASGLVSGFLAGFIGILAHHRKVTSAARAEAAGAAATPVAVPEP